MFDHFAKNSLISYPGVAQLVGRLIWVQDAGSSNLPTRTSKNGWFRTKSAVFLTFIRISMSVSGDWPHKSFFSFLEFSESFYALFFNLQQITYSISTSKCLSPDHFRIIAFRATRLIPRSPFLCLLRSIFCALNRNITLHQFDQYDRIYVSKVSVRALEVLLWANDTGSL